MLFDIDVVIDFVTDENLLAGVGDFPLIRDLLSILIFHLFLRLEDEPQCLSNGGLIRVGIDIEVGVPNFGSIHEEIIKVERFVIGLEVESADPNQWHRIVIVEIHN